MDVAARDTNRASRTATLAWLFASVVVCGGVALVQFRWVLGHFSSDGYLLDSGWLAYLLESSDPWLRNPAGVNDLSFYAHHLSPHLFLFGAPIMRLFRLNGFEILALHAALFFGLFTAALLWTTCVDAGWRVRMLLFLSAAGIGAVSNILFQAAGYPHYEIAMLSVTTLALAAWARGWRRLFIACVAWLPLIREDGGFYAAFVGLASWAVTDPAWRRPAHRSTLLVVIVGGLTATAASMLIMSQFFPGFDAFAFNFSGQSWSHVSGRFLADRAYSAVTNPNIVPVLLGCLVLTYWDVRYAAGFVLLSPLYLLHLLAVREEHGRFTLYFALPWLLPAVIWLVLVSQRSRRKAVSLGEAIAIFLFTVAMAAPVQAAAGLPGNFWYVVPWSFERPILDLEELRRFARDAHTTFASNGRAAVSSCASIGVAALIPSDLRPEEVLDPAVGVSSCGTALLMVGDMHYGALRTRLEEGRFQKIAERDDVELWIRPGPLK